MLRSVDTQKGYDMKNMTVVLGVLMVAGLIGRSSPTVAHDGDEGSNEARIRRGFEIAPVPLDLRGKDRQLVGLGSYLVNAVASCNDCHSADPSTEFAAGGNPYFKGNPPKVVNQATYLGGGRNFGALIPGTPSIVSRNLTPDRSGKPAGGLSFGEFREVLRTGIDLDHLHPNCSTTVTTSCFPAGQPFDGNLLQIMPWPILQSLTEHDIRAIYEYLRTVPCITGPATGVLHNDC
jgi:cytochrome c553